MDGNIAIYSSDMGMIGALVLELNDERIIKSELNTVVAAGGGIGWESSGDLRVRGICSKTTMDLSVYAGTLVNTIVVNGARFGANSGGDLIDVPLQDGETIFGLEYGIDRAWISYDFEGTICGLYFITNTFRYLGPYSGRVMRTAILRTSTFGHRHRFITLKEPCETEYTVTIPDGMEFSKFLADDLIAKPSGVQYGYWITGFKSQTELLGNASA